VSAELERRAVELASDRDAGASEILQRVLPLLAEAVGLGPAVARSVARAVCAAQPGMASLWNACAAAVAEAEDAGAFDRTCARLRRAPAALVRVAACVLEETALGVDVPRFLTLSYSSAVRGAVGEMATRRPVDVICAESRPRFEGRRMAADLARAGARVTIVTDSALPGFVEGACAALTGADAVTSTDWINKVGSRSLAEAASQRGIPTLVLATRDKLVPTELEPVLTLAGGLPDEVWPDRPEGVVEANPVFERIPLTLATLLVTESGPVSPAEASQLSGTFSRAAQLLRKSLAI
jgi:translation initiation factor 2B subunit (eIF-2B alpha/beta/delta family)